MAPSAFSAKTASGADIVENEHEIQDTPSKLPNISPSKMVAFQKRTHLFLEKISQPEFVIMSNEVTDKLATICVVTPFITLKFLNGISNILKIKKTKGGRSKNI